VSLKIRMLKAQRDKKMKFGYEDLEVSQKEMDR